MRQVAVLAVLLAALDSERVDACSGSSISGLDGFAVLPSTGSAAPRNAAIWIPAQSDFYATPIQPSDIVVEQGGVALPFDTRALRVAGETVATLYVITPMELFAAGGTIQVRVGDAALTRFTVAADEDVIAPTTPVIDHVEVTSGYFGGFSCGEPSDVAVTTGSNEAMIVLAEVDRPGAFLGISGSREVHAFDLPSGDYALQVSSVDVAGNTSAPVPLPMLTVPEEMSGCRTSGASGGAMVVLVLAALRRRR